MYFLQHAQFCENIAFICLHEYTLTMSGKRRIVLWAYAPCFFSSSVSSSSMDHHMVPSILGHKNNDFFFLSDQILKLTNWIWWQFSSIWHVSKRLGKRRFYIIQWWDWQSCRVRNGYSRFSCHVESDGKSILVCDLMRTEESALWYYILQLKSSDRNL